MTEKIIDQGMNSRRRTPLPQSGTAVTSDSKR